jgi:serine/threonine protein kinase/WD40 repeat protein
MNRVPDVSNATETQHDPRLAEAVDAYRQELRVGRRPDREAFCRRYPALGSMLVECLDALDFVHHAGHDLGGSLAPRVPPPAPAVQQTLGDYRLLREIGRGGMGVVYEAVQVSLDRRVALKVLPPAAVFDPRQQQRFQNEARAAACLHHPNIVPVYAVGTDRGMPYFAMQFIEGQTLSTIIHALRGEAKAQAPAQNALTTLFASPARSPDGAAGPTDPEGGGPTVRSLTIGRNPCRHTTAPNFFRTVARLGAQAARALEHAHQIGVVHRDIKPANLMLDTSGNLWVTDFGLAHFQGDPSLTATGDLVGTVRYMSPEQALGGRGYVDHRTDVYSLGITLYEFATLHVPFPGDDRQEVLYQVLGEDVPHARRVNPAVPGELETIIAKATARNPAERYATAHDLADDLERFLDDRPIRARRPSLLVCARKWARRHRSLVVSLAVSLALVLAGGIAGLASYAEQQHLIARDRESLAKEMEDREFKAKQDLHQALLGRAAALRRSREPGYRRLVWNDLRQAAALGLPEQAPHALRAEVLACLGDPLGLEPIASPQTGRAPRPPITPPLQAVLDGQFSARPRVSVASADGRFLATYGGTPTDYRLREVIFVLVWNQHRQVLVRKSFLGQVYDLQFTPDGSTLIAGCESGVIVWTFQTEMVTSFRTGSSTSLAVHPSGRLLATFGRHIELWSLQSNRLIASFDAPRGADRVEFSGDGKWLLAVSANKEHPLLGWPVLRTPEKEALDGHPEGVPSVAFSPDGRLIASCSKDRTLRLWDATTGALVRNCGEHLTAVEALAFSPDGGLLASGEVGGMVTLWDVATGSRLAFTEPDPRLPPGQVWRLQFSSDGESVVAGGLQGVAAWPLERDGEKSRFGRRLAIVTGALVYDLAVHPDGHEIAYLDGKGNLYACAVAKAAKPRLLPVTARVQLRSLNFDHEGSRLTHVTKDGKLGIWDWRAGTSLSSGPGAYHIALDPSGRWAATSTAAQCVSICDVAEGREVLTLPSEAADVWSLAWSPDSTRVAVGVSDGNVVVWNLEQVRATLAEFGISVPSTVFPSRDRLPGAD